MPRYVIFTFLVLGWAFYELSGGSDFQPKRASVEPVNSNPQNTVSAPLLKDTASLTANTGEPATKAAPARLPTADPEIAVTEATDETPVETEDNLNRVRASLNQGLGLIPEAGGSAGLTLISLGQGATGLKTAPATDTQNTAPTDIVQPDAPKQPEPDIREIRATRVNMRDGPGTIYPVVARLGLGRKVEVLDNSGTGWLKLRVVTNKQTGWIASSLVSKSKN